MKTGSLVAALILALFSAGCAGRSPVRIGVVGPLTGPSSAVGTGVRNGFLMLFDSGPAGDPPVEISVRDDMNNAENCLAAVQSLEAAGCKVIVLGTTSEAAARAIAYAERRDLLLISPTVSDDAYGGRDDLFFRVNSPSSEYGRYLADRASVRAGTRRAVLIGDENNARYTHTVFDSFTAELERKGGKVVAALTFHSDSPLPYLEILDMLNRTAPDAVVIVTASAEAAHICKQMERAGLRLPVYLPPWPLTLDLLANGGNAVEGATAASIVDLEYRTDAGRRFYEQYRAVYGASPSFTAMFGYETASILRRVLLAAHGTRPKELKRALLRIRTFDGLQGPISFDSFGDAQRPMFLYQIEGGTFRRIE
ncbi:ABC transporter substrate-binding protein [Salinispira pacifica]